MFEIGAEYNRRLDIHAVFGGQQQGGISTPSKHPIIFLFTGDAGAKHGYRDYWAADGFHLYGEGQIGPMKYKGGNRALRDHIKNGRRIFLFQTTGKSKPCVYKGEFAVARHYIEEDVPDTLDDRRPAIVFVLARVDRDEEKVLLRAELEVNLRGLTIDETVRQSFVEVRSMQALFRNRVELIERRCRVTGISDGRFLRASHIRPWAACDLGEQRVDGHNGLLLSHHIDQLFDRGWVTFDLKGSLIEAPSLPEQVAKALHLRTHRHKPMPFTDRQREYLEYHREYVFRQKRQLDQD